MFTHDTRTCAVTIPRVADTLHLHYTCLLTFYIRSVSGAQGRGVFVYKSFVFNLNRSQVYHGELSSTLVSPHTASRGPTESWLQIKHPLLHNKWLRKLAMDANKLQLMQTIEQFQVEHFIVCSTHYNGEDSRAWTKYFRMIFHFLGCSCSIHCQGKQKIS